MAAAGAAPIQLQLQLQLLHRLDAEISTFLTITTPIWSATTGTTSAAFLHAVDKLLAVLPSFSPLDPAVLDLLNSLINKIMSRLAREFCLLLDDDVDGAVIHPTHTDDDDDDDDDDDLDDVVPVARPIQDYNVIIDALSRSTIHDLTDIARRMAAAGYGNECAEAYASSRKEFVEESVLRVGIRRWTAEEVHAMDLPQLQTEIQRWNQGVKVVFLILFPSERRLADRVFVGLAAVADLGFANACVEWAGWMLEFAEAVAARSRQPELLFKIVDMYEVARDLLPEVEFVFSNGRCRFLVGDYRRCLDKLGETIRGIFTDLERLIRTDPVRLPIAGGAVHPITRYVINYLHAASVTWRTLEEIMRREEEEEEEDDDDDEATVQQQPRPSSSFSAQVGWIIERLNANLEAKSKAYANDALSCVFLMNNAQYMVTKLGDSELKHMLGEEWIGGQAGKIRQWLATYQRRSWAKVVAAVQIGKTGGIVSVSTMKQKLKLFNTYLDEICREQKGWTLADHRLREETRTAVVGAVLPAYRSFLERGRRELQKDVNAYIKYGPEQVEARIKELFGGGRSRAP